ncbi:MAG TPA: ATP-binding protein [Thermoanaerobaculia bacterium]|nr:ATP-binding protein [Thermoanaerobaculia bacterium]
MLMPIRSLIVEDSPLDAELTERELRRAGIEFESRRVITESEFVHALEDLRPHVILSDYNLPQFDGNAALELRNRLAPDIPFILISGTVGEEVAVATLKEGASDYILKDRMQKLPSAILRALNDADVRLERRAAEETREGLLIQLEQARRIESLGRVAATIAHEINNVLMGIEPWADYIERMVPDDERIVRATHRIRQSIRRGHKVTEEVLRFTRPVAPVFQRVLLQEWLKTFAEEMRAILSGRIELDLVLPAEPLFVEGDPLMLHQAFANLIFNARDAIEGQGRIEIRADIPPGGRSRYPFGVVPRPERLVHIRVRDWGTGISAEHIPRLFELLFTTKSRGTGLGLPVVHRVLMAHQGQIFVESEPGKGTTFHLFLPRAS